MEESNITHDDYHFSITTGTNDLAVLHCLRNVMDFEDSMQKS